jgi:hypothetical protein
MIFDCRLYGQLIGKGLKGRLASSQFFLLSSFFILLFSFAEFSIEKLHAGPPSNDDRQLG